MNGDAPAVTPASDIARPYPAGQTPGGYAKDGRPESPRPYPAGQELATTANANKAKHGGDLAR